MGVCPSFQAELRDAHIGSSELEVFDFISTDIHVVLQGCATSWNVT